MPVVVTRPRAEAQRWVDLLRARGVDAVGLPLIEISGAADRDAVRAAWGRIGDYRAAMFVSGNAVDHFFAAAPQGAVLRARAWAPGPATAAALRAHGVPPERIDEPRHDATQFDSESLWDCVGQQLGSGDRLLLVRGGDAQGRAAGRDWLSQQVRSRGARVDEVLAYRRSCPVWDDAGRARARLLASAGAAWLFSSSEAIGHLRSLLPGQAWGLATALATHPRIAQAARDAGFGRVLESRPGLDDVLVCLQSAG